MPTSVLESPDKIDLELAWAELEHLYATAPVGLCLLDRQLRFVRVNERMARINGVGCSDHIGRTPPEVVPTVGDAALAVCRRVLQTGEPIEDVVFDGLAAANDDPTRTWKASLHAVRASSGETVGVSALVREITDLGRTRRSLRHKDQQLRLMADSLPALIAYVNNEQRYEFANRTVGEWFGVDQQSIRGRHLQEVMGPAYEQLRERAAAALRGERIDVETVIARPDGGERPVHVRVEPHRSEGRVLGYFVLATDITQRRSAENALRDALAHVAELKDRLEAENVYLRSEVRRTHGFEEIVGTSVALRRVLGQAEQIAPTRSAVLLLGETGTGKELVARAIHRRSDRAARPMVKINCAALPANLIESELFGHERGAFTGAMARKIGRFELADRGTIFLDEIGELAPELQAKLLRVLQDGEFVRLGGTRTHRVDVRLIAATNRDLHQAMEDGRFRRDLFYRLSVFPIQIPPLRARSEDIPLLVWHFVRRYAEDLGKSFDRIPQPTMDALMRHSWPGNVRELQNVVERAAVMSRGPRLIVDEPSLQPSRAVERTRADDATPESENLDDIARAHIRRILTLCNWKIKGGNNAAERLGLHPSTLRHRMRKLGISRPR